VTDNFCRLPWTSRSAKDETVCWCGSRWTAGIRSTATSSAPPSNFIFFGGDDDDARADAPVSCAAISYASVNGDSEKTHEANRRAGLAQRSSGRSIRVAGHRFSRLLINNAALLMATKSLLRRAQTVNGRPHKCFSFADRFFANGVFASASHADVGVGKLNAGTWRCSVLCFFKMSVPVWNEISDLLLFFSYFASQNKEIKSSNYFFDVCCVN